LIQLCLPVQSKTNAQKQGYDQGRSTEIKVRFHLN